MQLIFKGAQLFLKADRKYQISRVCRADIQSNNQVIPDPEKLKDTKGRQCRYRERDNHTSEYLQMACTVYPSAFQ